MSTEVVVLIWLVCAAAGTAIGSQKGLAVQGFLLGLVLGLIGLVIIAVLPGKARDSVVTPISNTGPVMGSQTLSETLRELEALRADGLLSDAEFASQKRRVLGID